MKILLIFHAYLRMDLIGDGLKYSYVCYPIFQSDHNHIHVLPYLRHLEEFGLEKSEYIYDGVIEATLIMGGVYRLLGAYKVG